MEFRSSSLAGISTERLHTLCSVVQAGSIVAAAGPDPNRQSQFSRQLKQLEEALGATLFDRVGKTLKPNENGRRVAVAAQTFFGALDDLMDAAKDQAETVRLGAGESVLRWLVMPHLGELMAGDPPLRFDVKNLSTEQALREVANGAIDLAIVRSEAVPNDLQSELIAAIEYVLAVPRSLLRSREGAEVFEGRPLPFAELAGDGHFAKTVHTTAAAMKLNLRPVIEAATFSLLLSAVESGTAAAFLPLPAAKSLSEDRFALVWDEGMEPLNRNLCLTWKSDVSESRNSVGRAINRLRRLFTIKAPRNYSKVSQAPFSLPTQNKVGHKVGQVE